MSVATVIILGGIALMLINPNSPLSQNETIGAMQDKVNKNIENKFKATYNSTINKYGGGQGTIDPCKMANTFVKVQGVTQCVKITDPDD